MCGPAKKTVEDAIKEIYTDVEEMQTKKAPYLKFIKFFEKRRQKARTKKPLIKPLFVTVLCLFSNVREISPLNLAETFISKIVAILGFVRKSVEGGIKEIYTDVEEM